VRRNVKYINAGAATRDLDSALVSLRDRANIVYICTPFSSLSYPLLLRARARARACVRACACVCVCVCVFRVQYGIAAVNSIFACTAPERAPIARSRIVVHEKWPSRTVIITRVMIRIYLR